MSSRCEITELLVNECGHCKAKQSRPVYRTLYAGICPTCQQPIEEGEEAVWTLDGSSYEHARHAR